MDFPPAHKRAIVLKKVASTRQESIAGICQLIYADELRMQKWSAQSQLDLSSTIKIRHARIAVTHHSVAKLLLCGCCSAPGKAACDRVSPILHTLPAEMSPTLFTSSCVRMNFKSDCRRKHSDFRILRDCASCDFLQNFQTGEFSQVSFHLLVTPPPTPWLFPCINRNGIRPGRNSQQGPSDHCW